MQSVFSLTVLTHFLQRRASANFLYPTLAIWSHSPLHFTSSNHFSLPVPLYNWPLLPLKQPIYFPRSIPLYYPLIPTPLSFPTQSPLLNPLSQRLFFPLNPTLNPPPPPPCHGAQFEGQEGRVLPAGEGGGVEGQERLQTPADRRAVRPLHRWAVKG